MSTMAIVSPMQNPSDKELNNSDELSGISDAEEGASETEIDTDADADADADKDSDDDKDSEDDKDADGEVEFEDGQHMNKQAKVTTITVSKQPPEKADSNHRRQPTAVLVKAAIQHLNERSGSSLVAIRKCILSQYPELDKNRLTLQIKRYFKAGTSNGQLVQSKGKGAAGSFKVVKAPISKTTKPKDNGKTETQHLSKKKKESQVKSKKISDGKATAVEAKSKPVIKAKAGSKAETESKETISAKTKAKATAKPIKTSTPHLKKNSEKIKDTKSVIAQKADSNNNSSKHNIEDGKHKKGRPISKKVVATKKTTAVVDQKPHPEVKRNADLVAENAAPKLRRKLLRKSINLVVNPLEHKKATKPARQKKAPENTTKSDRHKR